MTSLQGATHWRDPAWRRALAEQHADALLLLRWLLTRRIRWLQRRTGRDPLAGYGIPVVTDAQADAALQPPDPAGEVEYYRSDAAMVRLGRSIEELETQLDERAAAMTAADTPFPLDQLTRLFGLDDFERALLVLALAPELDPAFERLYAYAQDDAARRHPTPALATDLLTGPATAAECQAAFQPDAPLFRVALLRRDAAGAAAASRPLRLEPRVGWYLQGVDVADDTPRLRVWSCRPVPEEIGDTAAQVIAGLAGRAGGIPAPLVNLVGRDLHQAAALAGAIAERAGLRLHEVALEPAGAPTPALLDRESRLRKTALLLDGVERGNADELVRLADHLAALVFLATPHPVETARPAVTVAVPPAQPASRRSLWLRALPELVDDPHRPLDALAHHFAVDPATVGRIASAARGTARLAGRPVTSADVWHWCRRYGRRQLSDLAEQVEPRMGWDDIVLPTDVRRQLEELVAQVRHRGLVYERWGFGARPVGRRGVTALFAGASGTGKTMAAEVVAAALGLDLFRIDLAGVVDKYVGETEKNLRRVFDAAERSGAVLFFDEADALFGKRTEVRDSHDRYANIEVNYLLQRMESYAGLAILATNRRSVLDRAFLRRLAFLVEFPFPTAETRLRIWQRVLPGGAPLDGVDFAALSRMELSGGNIRNVALNGAFLAAADGQRITMDVLMHAAAREYAKLDKAPTDAEFGRFPRAVGA